MFNRDLLQEILQQLEIQNKLLAKIAGVDEESLKELSVKAVDFSDASVVKVPSEEELIEEENLSIEDRMRERFDAISKSSMKTKSQFYEEEEISDILIDVNEG